jgi:hypothetical protein
MKKMPSLFKRLLPYVAIALLIVSCEPQKCDCDKPVFNAPGFPNSLDSVYDVAAKAVRAYKAGEAVFYTLRMEAAEVNALIADSAFTEIILSPTTNSLNNMTMFKLSGYALNANRTLLRPGRDSSKPESLNITIISEKLPSVFADSPTELGTFTLNKQTLKDLTTDKDNKPVKYTHLQITPLQGSLVYNTKAYNGNEPAANAKLPSGCCGHPCPPASSTNCDCSGVKNQQ